MYAPPRDARRRQFRDDVQVPSLVRDQVVGIEVAAGLRERRDIRAERRRRRGLRVGGRTEDGEESRRESHEAPGSSHATPAVMAQVYPLSMCRVAVLGLAAFAWFAPSAQAPVTAPPTGAEPGWRTLGSADFVRVNDTAETWTWRGDVLVSTGVPIGVLRSARTFTNVELLIEWRHLQPGGNSGVFLWVPESALRGLAPGVLPDLGIEVQMLDHAFREQYETRTGRKGDWFTTHGDVFAVGRSKLTPFPPLSPNGARSFPKKLLSRGAGEWNHMTSARWPAKCDSGSTVKKSLAVRTQTHGRATSVLKRKARRSSFVISV